MVINRRIALKQLVVISAGAALVPSCMTRSDKPSALFKNIRVTEDQEMLLASLADTLLPKTTTPGAKDVSAQLFAAKMIDDCLSKSDQQKWQTGLSKFSELTEKRNGKSFSEFNIEDQKNLLSEFEDKKIEGEEINFFYSTVKRFILRGYTSSEYFMTNVQKYNIIPGPYQGCVPVNSAS